MTQSTDGPVAACPEHGEFSLHTGCYGCDPLEGAWPPSFIEGPLMRAVPAFTVQAIGISGFARSGKTTLANYIESEHGYERRHIAEPLRGMLRELLRWNQIPDDMIERYLTGDLKEQVIPEIGCTSRHAQITLGTEWGRERIHPALWADTWARAVEPGDRVQNDSVRFPNEEQAIHRLGGFTVLVLRRGTEPAAYKWGWLGRLLYRGFGIYWGVHDSERIDRLRPDAVIFNDGSIEDLHAAFDEIYRRRLLHA